MSLAWGSLALLVALLPGVLFFVGLQFPEKFTRDAADRSALGQLAGVLLVSLFVHGLLYVSGPVFCGHSIPCVDVGQFLTALTVDRPGRPVALLAQSIANNRAWIFAYLMATSALGLLLGWGVGGAIVRGGRFKVLGQHGWAHRLDVGNKLTSAWVLTHISHENKFVIYGGFLDGFHLKKDGTFSYIVLSHVRRLYLKLDEKAPVTLAAEAKQLGESTREKDREELATGRKRYVESRLVIEGEDIANVVFDRYEVGFDITLGNAEYVEAMTEALKEFRVKLEGQLEPKGTLDVKVIRKDERKSPGE